MRSTGHMTIAARILKGPGVRLTREPMAGVEALLINVLKPRGNVQSCSVRTIARPGMIVDCRGDWPHARRRFVDRAERNHCSLGDAYEGVNPAGDSARLEGDRRRFCSAGTAAGRSSCRGAYQSSAGRSFRLRRAALAPWA